MSDKLSERMRSWFEDGVTPFESQIHAWADEVAALEQKLENERLVRNAIEEQWDVLRPAFEQRVELMGNPPQHEADFKGVPCPYGGPGPWDHNECDCGYWGRLENWAKALASQEEA